MLPSADSIGAENHGRKPNGIHLDSVRPENALALFECRWSTSRSVGRDPGESRNNHLNAAGLQSHSTIGISSPCFVRRTKPGYEGWHCERATRIHRSVEKAAPRHPDRPCRGIRGWHPREPQTCDGGERRVRAVSALEIRCPWVVLGQAHGHDRISISPASACTNPRANACLGQPLPGDRSADRRGVLCGAHARGHSTVARSPRSPAGLCPWSEDAGLPNSASTSPVS